MKDIRTAFTPAQVSNVQSNAAMSHKVSRGTLEGSNKTWIKKEMESASVARTEFLAQEFFRLIIPHQPETRILLDTALGTHYILSEEVPGYHNLPEGKAEGFGNGAYIGLGQVIVTSLFVQEIDLKNGNLGLNNQNQVIKIDGDWSFAEFKAKGLYRITPEIIAQLPYPNGFHAFNWLDLKIGGIAHPNSRIVNPELVNNPQFRAELNQAMLKICLLPDSFIKNLVDTYIPAGGDRYLTMLKERREALRLAAVQNPSFQAYLRTPQSEVDKTSLIIQMNSFVSNGTTPVISPDERYTIGQELNTNIQALRTRTVMCENQAILSSISSYLLPNSPKLIDIDTARSEIAAAGMNYTAQLELKEKFSLKLLPYKQCEPLVATLRSLLTTMAGKAAGPNDTILNTYVANMSNNISDFAGDRLKLQEIQAHLNQTLASVGSPQVQAVKDSIEFLRKKNSRGKGEKADAIESALYQIPLDERGDVISKKGPPNGVQEALATHRHFGKSGKLYKKEGTIDEKKAADTFLILKARFKDARGEEKPAPLPPTPV